MKTNPFQLNQKPLFVCCLGFSMMALRTGAQNVQTPDVKPNIIFILADDLGYGDLESYGQKQIRTPNLNALSAEGIRFTSCYAGSTVCAPSRCSLMTGKHMGHARIRGNANVPLEPEDVTVAEVLKKAGYATGIFGKWGLGEPETNGTPNKKGFDEWFGFVNQGLAHNYYPETLWENDKNVTLEGNKDGKKEAYSHDLFTERALKFIKEKGGKPQPFFLYLPYQIPHANNELARETNNGQEVPSDAPYTKESWPQVEKNFAAMVTRMDSDVGKIAALLKEMKIDKNTIVFFSSDNGPHREGGHDEQFFHSSGPFKGYKRSLHEGGIRVPMIVRWPGRITPGTSDFPWAFWDFLPTVAEIAGAEPPRDIDGISIRQALGGEAQNKHEYFYWEFHEGGFFQAVRMKDWKAVRKGAQSPLELYNLKDDMAENNNIADKNPEIVKQIEEYIKTARTDSPHWKISNKMDQSFRKSFETPK